MDQIHLPFVMDDIKTYNSTSAEEVWYYTGSSGLEKGQSTAQLILFAAGSVLPPLVIFREVKRLKNKEKQQLDERVIVKFQKIVWCGKRS